MSEPEKLERGFEDYRAASRSQAIAADPGLSAWVAANAGSGKTKVLIDRVARLLLGGADPASILCITYTKAAANEMLSRLFKRLGSWSVMPEAELRAELAKLDPRTKSYGDEDIRRARALFARALETPGGLRIETIHAFCSRILRRFPLEAGVAPGFQEMEDDQANDLWEDAAKRAIINAGIDAPEALRTLALAGEAFGARREVDTLRGHAAAITEFAAFHQNNDAGMADAVRAALRAPDTGKDNYLANQMAKVDWQGLKNILPSLLAESKRDEKRSADAIEAGLKARTPSEQWEAVSGICFKQDGDLFARTYNAHAAKDAAVAELLSVKGDLGSVIEIALETQAALRSIIAAERSIALLQVGLPALAHYQDLKSDQAALDFDDLIIKTKDLLTKAGVAAWVLYKLDGGLEHVLLDEAQDTSPHQWTLINALTEDFFSGASATEKETPRTLFVVGDEKQSIYSFQGADPAKFITERQSFAKRSGAADLPHKLPEMKMSFRSSPEILKFVDAVWNSSPKFGVPYAKEPPSEADDILHTAHRAGEPGFVEFWPITPPAEEADDDPWTPFANLKALDQMTAASPKVQLANKVAENVSEMIARGDAVWDGGDPRPMHAGDVLILVKKRKGGLFDALIKALKAKSIPVAGADRLVLSDHIGVQDCLNLIRFALLPSDDLTLAEILRGPFCNLVDDDVHLFPLAHGRKSTLWQRLRASEDPQFETAKALAQHLIDARDTPAYEFLTAILEGRIAGGPTGWDMIGARLGAPARDPIEALLSRALAHDAAGAASLQTFLADVERDETDIKRDLEEASGAVRVMTVHGAKGLQAPVVILPDTTGKSDPKAGSFLYLGSEPAAPIRTGKTKADTPEMAAAREAAEAKEWLEHRRLLYVALTRAQDRLLICGAWSGRKSDKTGRPKFSWHEMCEAGLTELGIDIPEIGGEPVSFGPPPTPLGPAEPAGAQNTAPPDWLRRDAPSEDQAQRYIAPTSLSPGESPVLPPFRRGHAARLNRGRLIHALLQRLPDIAPDDRETAGKAFLASDPSLSPQAQRELLSAAMNVLHHPGFSDVFQTGGRAEAPVIGTSDDLPPGTILNGRVDRLVVTDHEVLIVDFKTDRPPPSAPEGVGDSYILQMAAYAAVLKNAYPGKPVRSALLWTDAPKLMELPENLLLEALKGLRREA